MGPLKEYGTKTFGALNAERYDAMYEDLPSAYYPATAYRVLKVTYV